jgi:outer membrane protein assembly factor BamB
MSGARAIGSVLLLSMLIAVTCRCRSSAPRHLLDARGRTPQRYARPASNLDVIWRRPAGQRLGETAGPSARLTPEDFVALPEASAEDIAIGTQAGPWLAAVDKASGRTLWRVRCNDTEDSRCEVQGYRAGDVAVFGGTLSYRTRDWSIGLFAVDVHSGRELWRARTDFLDAPSVRMAADDEHVYVLSWGHLLAFDVRSGHRAWERRLPPQPMSLSRGTQLIAGFDVVVFWEIFTAVHIARADTGDDIVTIPWTDLVGDLHLRDGVLYVLPLWGHGRAAVAAYDPSDGHLLWRHEDPNWSVVPPAFLDNDTIYVRRADDSTLALNNHGTEVVALDRATGKLVWRRKLGRTDFLSLVPSQGGAPLLVADAMGREVIAFARAERPAQPASVSISGAVRIQKLTAPSLEGLRVLIGDTVATTDRNGHFAARVSAMGAVGVKLLDMPPVDPRPVAPIFSVPEFVNVDQLDDSYRTELVVREVAPWPPD